MKKFKVLCPLTNFQIPWNVLIGHTEMSPEEKKTYFQDRERQVVDGIELFEGVKVRLFSKEDGENFSSSPFSSNFLRERISPRTYVLEKIITAKRDHRFEADKIIRNIVLALRLFKEGHVYGDDMFYFLPSEKGRFDSWSRERPQPSVDIVVGDMYALKFEEIPSLRSFIQKIQRIDMSKRKSLHLACKRFERAYEEGDIEDRLIDYMIAFEALFLKGEKMVSSRGKTIGIACSTLLGRNEEERTKIKKTLKEAYSIRNRIVHGAEYKRAIEPAETVEETGDYLRQSIRKMLD